MQRKIVVSEDAHKAAMVIFETGQASVSMIQRKLHFPYGPAAKLVDQLESAGVVGPFLGITPRPILITKEFYLSNYKISNSPEEIKRAANSGIDIDQIIKDELEWRKQQGGAISADDELEEVDRMSGQEFEQWCADLLERAGFVRVEVTRGSGDQGVDVLAEKDGIKYAFQCKCYSSDLGNKPVQEVHAGKYIYQCHVGVVITNRYFTQGAKDAAKATGILLWDRDKLWSMIEAAS